MAERTPQSGACTVEGCTSPQRKRSWCAAHYSQAYRTGRDPVPFGYKWAAEKCCLICGVTGWERKGRKVCSGACQQMFQRWGTDRPTEVACADCGAKVDLTAVGRAGRVQRSDVKLCYPCRRRSRVPVSLFWLERRDGPNCGICGEHVDLSLRRSNPAHARRSASIDHVIPVARGGGHDPSNLQLAHLHCNQVKQARVDSELSG